MFFIWGVLDPPAIEREARTGFVTHTVKLRASCAFAGGTPAVPANHLTLRSLFLRSRKSLPFSRSFNGAKGTRARYW
jgi:hypothetical protein